MSTFIHKSHNVSVLMYHIVCPTKYRKAVFTEEVDTELKNICIDISNRYEIIFIEIGADKDHVHFLIQSVPMYSPKKIVQIIKSISAREILKRCPEVKKQLWGGKFWSDGYFVSTVGKNGYGETIKKYVKNQGNDDYKQFHKQSVEKSEQLMLW
ncbi:IS200/IS605 family transposase [Shewanella surugensis]|uniref:IS200/IS605 family transposase n=1 Tax=Shewanella surugensis TaxID=212020 RepID=A0ABT0LBD1_9GAMM|nr:IS200/IS605 family transposase [Shewanella surugensis]MCL1124979.1 IS200/IS605 family transposase [Shewanella surugensis]